MKPKKTLSLKKKVTLGSGLFLFIVYLLSIAYRFEHQLHSDGTEDCQSDFFLKITDDDNDFLPDSVVLGLDEHESRPGCNKGMANQQD